MQNRCNAKQGQPDDQPHEILGRQLAPPDRGMVRCLQGVLDQYRIYQIVEPAQISPLLPGEKKTFTAKFRLLTLSLTGIRYPVGQAFHVRF